MAIYLALFASIFSVFANAFYLKSVLKGNLKAGGAAIAHLGFALMIGGMLIASGNRKVISDNSKTGLFIPFDKDPTGREYRKSDGKSDAFERRSYADGKIYGNLRE